MSEPERTDHATFTIRDRRHALALLIVLNELATSTDKFGGKYASAHEFRSVLDEEVDEAWDEIKANKVAGWRDRLLHEVSQVASVALKFMTGNCSIEELENEARKRGLIR